MANDHHWLPKWEAAVTIVQAHGSGRVVGVLGHQSIFKVTSAQTGGAYAILQQHVPSGHGPPLHVQRHETEVFYLLEGRFELTVGTQTIEAQTDATALLPRNISHTFRNIGSSPGRLILTVIPGRFADYFLEVDGLPDHDLETIKPLLARYDVELVHNEVAQS
jgi:mannose-6-phosphate isomerase-like protein (cupin superfamily)